MDRPLTDEEVSSPASKPLSDDEVSASEQKPVDISDPVNEAVYKQSPVSKVVDASQGNWFTKSVSAYGQSANEEFSNGGNLGLSADSIKSLQNAGVLEDYKSNYLSLRKTITGAVLIPAAAGLDLAQRTLSAAITAPVAAGLSLIGSAEHAIAPESSQGQGMNVPGEARDLVNNVLMAAGVNDFGVPIERLTPTMRQALASPEATAAKVAEDLPLKAPVKSPLIDEKSGNLNLKYVDADSDVKSILATSSQAYADEEGIVVTHAQTVEEAEKFFEDARKQLADGTPEVLADYMRGDAVNRPMDYTARRYMTQSAVDEIQAAKQAVATGSPADAAAAMDAAMRTDKATGIVSEMGAEMGRTLNARQIPVGAEGANLEAAMDKLSQTNMTPEERMRLMASFDDPQNVAKFIGDVKKPTWGDMAIFHIISNYLSGPITHSAYFATGELQTLIRTGLETPIAAAYGKLQSALGLVLKPADVLALNIERGGLLSKLADADKGITKIKAADSVVMEKRLKEIATKLNNGTTVMPAEIIGRLYGMGQGQIDGARAAGRSLKTGEMQMLPGEEAAAKQASKDAADKAISEDKSAEEAKKLGDAAYNRTAVQIKNPIVDRAQFIKNPYMKGLTEAYGKIIGVPTRVASAIHTFQKFSGYAEASNALAYRQAASEGLTGDRLGARVAQIKANMPAAMMKDAAEQGKYASLVNKPGEFGQKVEELAHVNGWTRFVMPFSRISTNLTSQTFLERTPFGLFSEKVRGDLMGKNGAAAQATSAARMTVGTSIVAGGAWLRSQGITNGIAPDKPNERARAYMEGKPPDTVRINDHNYPFRLFGLPGRLMSIGGDVHDVYQSYSTDEDLADATGHSIHLVGEDILRENALAGLSDFLDAVNSHDPELSKRYALNAIASAAVPYSVGLSQTTHVLDPYMRSTIGTGFMDRLRKTVDSRLPWEYGSDLPQVDIFGRPMERGGDYEAMLKDPVMQNLVRLNMFPAKVPVRFGNVKLDDQQYFDYATKAGTLYYHNAESMVNDPNWPRYDAKTQADMLHTAQKDARADARSYMCMRYPGISKSCAKYNTDLTSGEE